VTLLAMTITYAGFAALSFSMERHQRLLWGHVLPRWKTRPLRYAGFLLLSLSLGFSMISAGIGVGIVLWLGILTATPLLLIPLLAYAPRSAIMLALAGPAVAALLVVVGTAGGG
jgi:hypothetical protein